MGGAEPLSGVGLEEKGGASLQSFRTKADPEIADIYVFDYGNDLNQAGLKLNIDH